MASIRGSSEHHSDPPDPPSGSESYHSDEDSLPDPSEHDPDLESDQDLPPELEPEDTTMPALITYKETSPSLDQSPEVTSPTLTPTEPTPGRFFSILPHNLAPKLFSKMKTASVGGGETRKENRRCNRCSVCRSFSKCQSCSSCRNPQSKLICMASKPCKLFTAKERAAHQERLRKAQEFFLKRAGPPGPGPKPAQGPGPDPGMGLGPVSYTHLTLPTKRRV